MQACEAALPAVARHLATLLGAANEADALTKTSSATMIAKPIPNEVFRLLMGYSAFVTATRQIA
jgi:hypothetical protein